MSFDLNAKVTLVRLVCLCLASSKEGEAGGRLLGLLRVRCKSYSKDLLIIAC